MKPIKLLRAKTLLLSLILIASCDAPRTDRKVAAGSTSPSLFNPYMGTTSSGNTTSGTTSGGTSTGGDTGSVVIPADANGCSWSMDGVSGFQSQSAHLDPNGEDTASEGAYTVCQSTSNPSDVYIQTKAPQNIEQLCLIPTYHSGSNSVYVGEPRCLNITSNTTLYKVGLIKNRAGFTSYPITGVMIMKDKAYDYGAPFYQKILSPDAYIFCSQWLAQYGDPSYCVAFQAGGHYVYHQF